MRDIIFRRSEICEKDSRRINQEEKAKALPEQQLIRNVAHLKIHEIIYTSIGFYFTYFYFFGIYIFP